MRKKLHTKGWSKEEIDHAMKIMKKAEKNKHPDIVKVEKSLYWFALILGVIGTIMLSLILIPIFIINSNAWSYILTGLFGFLLGLLIIMIIKDLQWVEHYHHFIINILVLIIAIFNFFIVVTQVNKLVQSLGLGNYHSPLSMGLVYTVCFIVPYIIFLIIKRK